MANKLPTAREFQARFPTEDSCLEHLMRTRFGAKFTCAKCDREARYYRVKARRAYECEHCGFQVYPTADTPFHGTRTSLRDWFFVMFLFCASRNGVAAKEVQRQIGVTYKTAWRMCHLIREYMGFVDGDDSLGGPDGPKVQMDKTFIGGVRKGDHTTDNKMVVLGMVEEGGEIVTKHVQSRHASHVIPVIKRHVKKGSRVVSDKARTFQALAFQGYNQTLLNKSDGELARGPYHTSTIEGYWAMLKRGINGTYIHVSQKHLQKYLYEFEFRYNLRKRPEAMLNLLMASFPA